MPMTFKEFTDTSTFYPNLAKVPSIAGNWDAGTVQPGYVYTYDGSDCYIERMPDGRVYLILGNEDWIADADDLEKLEVKLYEWAQTELVDGPSAVRVAAPETLSQLFAMSLGLAASEPQLLDEVPLDSPCGKDCAAAIEAGVALRIEAHKAVGDEQDANIAAVVERACSVFIRG